MIAYGPHVVAWVTEKLGVHPQAYGSLAQGVGETRNGQLVAGVVFCSFNGKNIHAHIASDGSRKWLNKLFLTTMFEYPFESLQAHRITATTEMANKQAQRWLERTGFQLEAVMLQASPTGDDVLIYRM